jgi:adenylate kinase
MRLILMGAPGSGKGTQAEYLVKALGVPAISTGNILREAIKRGDELGLSAKAYVDAGKLVPDDLMVGVIRERVGQADCQKGFILDGFPRTVAQAQAMEDYGIPVDTALSLEVPDEDIQRRMSGRRVCERCGAVFHVEHRPPRAEGVCDICGGAVVQRADDAPETVLNRLRVYHENTEPVKGYYSRLGKLRPVSGTGGIPEIGARMLEALGLR